MDRRHFFKSLGSLMGAASLSPTIFIPKFEPVKWKVIQRYPIPYDYVSLRDYYGQWKWTTPMNWMMDDLPPLKLVIDAPTVYALKPPEEEYIDCVFHVKDA